MKTKDITQIALTVALIIVLGLLPAIPLGIIPVPIVLQNMGIMLTGLILGPKKGTISIAIFMLLVAIGMPILTGGNGGLAVFIGPTCGYLLAWLLTPCMISILKKTANNFKNTYVQYLIIWLLIIVVDLIGSIGLSIQSKMPLQLAIYSNFIFIPGDTVKLFIAIFVSKRLQKMTL
ncbi:biotin transporter BioY [Apilactobacillus ozensis]|uniref:Biotin transporter n=1 Tax=Apilactobacillus ozensis DSM 23829 = JCM 17196 TaxID=1423781 RepID=A0A0R2AWL6_9LACO|nr:biotin transporter BioY [Apilactobacillus ozensis]KRM69956.1 biotin transporter BioY [Apilactobacillus ozensis DSM 23829 = JCM 17196]MCK8606846.1 biotin transporter BioY [Apilactobacillus ozensis]